MKRISLLSSSAGLIAALSLAAAPAAAADVQIRTPHTAAPAQNSWHADSVTVNRDRYRDRYHDRYRDRYRGRHRNTIDAGDVIGGILVIGAIAAVASAVSKPQEPRYPAPYPSRTGYTTGSDVAGRGIDNAADMCVREIERDARVNSVDSVERSGSGWRVTGTLFDGNGFTCRIGPDGRFDGVEYSQRASVQGLYRPQDDRQWSDDRYAAAWGNADPGAPPPEYSDRVSYPSRPVESSPVPAYPGGPVPGESYEDYPEYTGDQDERYRD